MNGEHATAARVAARLAQTGNAVGLTTVYRHLDKLVEQGKVRRYNIDGITGACYQYALDGENCHEHFHLKCEDCGRLLHLECDALSEIGGHISREHSFEINALKTVFYGKCGNCLYSRENTMEENI